MTSHNTKTAYLGAPDTIQRQLTQVHQTQYKDSLLRCTRHHTKTAYLGAPDTMQRQLT